MKSLEEDTVRAIRQAGLERQLVFPRDQRLDAAAYMAFVRRVGRQVEYPFVRGIPGSPEIIEVEEA